MFSLALFLSISSVLSLFFFSFFVLVFSFLRSVTSATGPPPLHLDSPYAHTPLSHIAQVSQSVTAGLLMFSVSHVSIHSSCTICPKAKITHVPFRSGAGLMYAVQIIQLVKDALCVCVWSCVLVCVIVHSYMKSVVQCSLVASLCVLQDFCLTLWRSSLVQNRNSWILDKVPHHLVTLRFPWLDPVSELPVLHMVMLHADGLPPLYLFIFSHLTPPPQVTQCAASHCC